MIHQVLGGAEGQAEATWKSRVKYMPETQEQRLNTILSASTPARFIDVVEKACDRDNFSIASVKRPKNFGLVDNVVASRKDVPDGAKKPEASAS